MHLLVDIVNNFKLMAELSQVALWVSAPFYKKFYYLSPRFKSIWEQSRSPIYDDPQLLKQQLVHSDQKRVYPALLKRHLTTGSNNIEYYRIVTPSKTVKYIRDACFNVYSNTGHLRGLAGHMEEIDETTWLQEISSYSQENTRQKSTCKTHASSANKHTLCFKGKHIQVTPREIDCLYYFSKGLTSKEVARKLNISHRTVEKYIEYVKEKTGFSRRGTLFANMSIAELELVYNHLHELRVVPA